MDMKMQAFFEEEYRKYKKMQPLLQAISDRDDAAVEAMLQQEDMTALLQERSYDLCSKAIQSGCSLELFLRLLQHRKPLTEIRDEKTRRNTDLLLYVRLVQEAAKWNHAAVLEYLLDQGFSSNTAKLRITSPLELALDSRAEDVLRLLADREDVDFTVTHQILTRWGAMGMDSETDACLRIVAGRLLGRGTDAAFEELPLLPGLTVEHAAQKRNWPLVFRLCREGRATEKECGEVLRTATSFCCDLDIPECAHLLDGLLNFFPGLLKKEYVRYLLAVCMLQGEEEDVQLLRPWVDQMPGRAVVLCERILAGVMDDITAYLHRWDARMGPRFYPVLYRNRDLPLRFHFGSDRDPAIRTLMHHCKVQGTPPKGKVSRLAATILTLVSPDLLVELLEQGVLFSKEDMGALLHQCETMMDVHRRKKQVLLQTYYQKEVDYEL